MHRPTLCTLEASCFLRACHLEVMPDMEKPFSIYCVELEGTYKCQRYSKFFWIGWILSNVY
jgi:hypothetical protein